MHSQEKKPVDDWRGIDSLVKLNKELGTVLSQVRDIRQKAGRSKRQFEVARTYQYELAIADARTEDSLWFKNSAFIDTLLFNHTLAKELEWALLMIKAKRLNSFTKRNLRFQRARYLRNDIPVNYAAYTNPQLDSITKVCFEEAKKLATALRATDAMDALWLSEDPLRFLIKPGLFDITILEQIRFGGSIYYPVSRDKMQIVKEWLSFNSNEFISNFSTYADTIKYEMPVILFYGEWIMHHAKDRQKKFFIETLARKAVFDKYRYYETGALDLLYENYLEGVSLSPYSAAKAQGIYELCYLLKAQAQKYFPAPVYSYGVSGGSSGDFDTAYRYKAAKAVALYKENEKLLDSFSYLKKQLFYLIEDIKAVHISLTAESNIIPGQPSLVQVKFKNIDTLHYRIIRVNSKDYETLFDKGNRRSYALLSGTASKPGNESQQWLYQLINTAAQVQKKIAIPETNDYNYHLAYEKIEVTEAGHYVLLFSDKAVMDTSGQTGYLFFNASNIAILNNDNRIYILDRLTGKPLQGASVIAVSEKTNPDKTKAPIVFRKNYIVNKQGFIITPGEDYTSLEVKFNKDTIRRDISYNNRNSTEDIYDKEEYDNLVEYYADNAFVQVFTDRSIYRPGQTVQYKILFLTRNPKTGDYIVINKENFRGRLFSNIYKKWIKEEEPWIYISDPFYKEMDSFKVKLNEFGSISGKFQIPKTAATGEWTIESDMLDTEWSEGTFMVEEYKRPSYEVSIQNPRTALLPGDSFSFTVKIKSFAGASLNNVRVDYDLTRIGNYSTEGEVDLADTSAFTNADGELIIAVNDSLVRKYAFVDSAVYNFTYTLNISAIDETGESYEEEASVTVSNRPITINLSSETIYNLSEGPFLQIKTVDKNAGVVSRPATVRVYKLDDEELFPDTRLQKADTWFYDIRELQRSFPYTDFYINKKNETRRLVTDTVITTEGMGKLSFDTTHLSAGRYEIEVSVQDNGIVRGEQNRKINFLNTAKKQLPGPSFNFSYLPYNMADPGSRLVYYYGNSEQEVYSVFHISYFTKDRNTNARSVYFEKVAGKGLNEFKFDIPETAIGSLKMVHIFVLNNQVYKNEKTVYINAEVAEKPEIIIEKYRTKLVPGGKETFTLSVKTKNTNKAAEVMTTLYDASLDKLAEHDWQSFIRRTENMRGYNVFVTWPATLAATANSSGFAPSIHAYPNKNLHTTPIWWYNSSDSVQYRTTEWGSVEDLLKKMPGMVADALVGSLPGLSVSAHELNEVVVVGYGIQKRMSLTAASSSITLRGSASLSSYKQPLIILDGVPFEGDINSINSSLITAGLVLKGADATALYGARAAEGVLILSTRGEIILPEERKEEIIPRKNFSETAFFFPALHADKNGYYTFSFTMPESVTEWNWKILAHTKDARYIYAEKKLVTQLPLMVQPNMPRFLYQGDAIVLQSRLTNLDTTDISGSVTCRIEDVVTGEDLTNKAVAKNQLPFSANRKANISAAFGITIPVGQTNPVKVIIAARSQYFADAEEHIIPVLSPKAFVRANTALVFNTTGDTTLRMPDLPAGSEVYGLGISIHPQPQSALINSLPYLANYSYDCAEQTFNKLLAYATAWFVMRTDSIARALFEKSKAAIVKDGNSADYLPDEIAEESMPWLRMANQVNMQQRQLFNLLDTSKTGAAIEKLLSRLYKLQQPDGGLSWFDEGKSDFYISCYVLNGFGQLYATNPAISAKVFDHTFWQFVANLLKYCDTKFDDVHKNSEYYSYHYLHTRGRWLDKYPLADSSFSILKGMLDSSWKQADNYSLHNQAVLILSTFQYTEKNDALYKKAVSQLQSIRELAIADDINGIRWKQVADADDLTVSTEETVALLAEAFGKGGMNISDGILKWLMTTRSGHHWKTTKATAAVVNLLGNESRSAVGLPQALNLKLADTSVSVTNDMLNGNLIGFVPLKSFPASVSISKQMPGNTAGNLSWYYFTSSGVEANNGVKLSKQLYRFDKNGTKKVFTNNDTVQLGEMIEVVLTIESAKPLSYLHINDKIVAAFEPVENSSGYEYNQFDYYKSIRDAGPQFFASFMPSGKHEINYRVKVVHEGSFTGGLPVLQCMYAPELTAYAEAVKLNVKK